MGLTLAMVWGFGISPTSNFLYVSYSDSLARQVGNKVKTIINSDFFQYIFPGLKISQSEAAKDLFSVQQQLETGEWVQQGGLRACSIRSAVTGFAAGVSSTEKFGGVLFIDDPIKASELTMRNLDETYELFHTVVNSRKNHPNTPICVTMQRLHTQDLTGKLLNDDTNSWEELKIPVKCPDTGLINDPVLYPINRIQELKRGNPKVFWAQYMQQPMEDSDEKLFDYTKLGFYKDKDSLDLRGYNIYISFDLATSSKTSADYSSIVVAAVKGQEVVVLDNWLMKTSVDIAVGQIAYFAHIYNPTAIYTEKGGIYNMVEPMLQKAMIEQGRLHRVETFPRTVDKYTFAQPLANIVNQGYLRLPASLDAECLQQLKDFPNCKHDDYVDALAGIVVGSSGESVKQIRQEKVNYNEINDHINRELGNNWG